MTLAQVSTYSPVAYWSCDETSGVRYDSTLSNNDLADNNTVTYGTGLLGNACDFESTNSEYLNIADASQVGLDLSSSFSFSFWFKLESFTDGLLIAKNDNHSSGYMVMVTDGGGADGVSLYDSSETPWKVAHDLDVGVWYHAVVVYDSGTTHTWINGTKVATLGGVGSVSGNAAYFSLGRTQVYNSNFYDGMLDEVAVFNSALSTSTVLALYNSGTPLCYDCEIGGGGTTTSTSSASSSQQMVDSVILGMLSLFGLFLFIVIGLTAYLIVWTIRA